MREVNGTVQDSTIVMIIKWNMIWMILDTYDNMIWKYKNIQVYVAGGTYERTRIKGINKE